jgi:hypothetical protein
VADELVANETRFYIEIGGDPPQTLRGGKRGKKERDVIVHL